MIPGWISSGLSILASVAKAALAAIGWSKQTADQNTGKKLGAAETNEAVINETQAVNDARSDPANLERVREQSFRD